MAPPTISGTPQRGSILTASRGTWTNNPTAFAYQWKRCDPSGGSCVSIPGSTGPQHRLGNYAVGKTIRVTVTASNAAGSDVATSAATGVVAPSARAPRISVRPTVTGEALLGQRLVATTGEWANSPVYYTFQWRRCNASGGGCVNVAGATRPEYRLDTADVGFTLRVVVASSNDGGVAYARTDHTDVVAPAPAAPTPRQSGGRGR
jgi:hypothetical protein